MSMDNHTTGYKASGKATLDVASHFSCDLVGNSFKHKYFLQTIHELGISLRQPDFESLRRYKNLWLPLVNGFHHDELIPPPDIAWLWHCHRLAPRDYVRYATQEFGVILEANPPFALQTNPSFLGQGAAFLTRQLWQKLYPDEPFFLSEAQRSDEAIPRLLSGFDLLASTERQATFLWQVSGERFDDVDFLEEGVGSYYKFLTLKSKAKQMILVPTYQIDLMWHTHILSSISLYNKDCTAMIGSTFHHDDSLNDRSEGGVLDTSYRATKELWRKEFGADYVVQGGMYRGEPPSPYFDQKWTATEANIILVNLEMGASSTSPADGPTQWASVDGRASDGQPAFIPTNTRMKMKLAGMPHRENYVLGKHYGKVGYFHLETREAHFIICNRLTGRIRKLESDIACEKCCCGNPADIARREERLRETQEVQSMMTARRNAPNPDGNVGGNRRYYDDGYGWIYPAFIWDSCGGACGGTVACSTGTTKADYKLRLFLMATNSLLSR